ncbi:PITH domain-containing protein 1 [Auxenochlorella protothecoides]|uniref:PITH domain-containing protein 1 n=1 Tax=Auxenochlorella protothecoides TaxID=3075 RepID=A0A087SL66_AUXPR|nr:PITH domain-containing protein 1 [Auxenochlorella protothecoides]KFM26470.1 PITH domain-containing protein 1 [Auxenochlorella protothecoides]
MPRFEGCCSHDHDCEEEDCSTSYSLYKNIDTPRVRCLNELEEGSCQAVFKPWHARLDSSGPNLRSQEDDPELLLYVPFDGAVSLKAICVIGAPDGRGPAKLRVNRRVYVNREDLDFGMVADLQPIQEWDLVDNTAGVVDYPTQASKFNGVHSLTLHFPETLGGGDATQINFVGFKGTCVSRDRRAVEAVYETKPMPSDHKVADLAGAAWRLG